MEKIIIRNGTDLPMAEVIVYVSHVISEGRVSDGGKSYCYITTWTDGTVVYATHNKQSDTFYVTTVHARLKNLDILGCGV